MLPTRAFLFDAFDSLCEAREAWKQEPMAAPQLTLHAAVQLLSQLDLARGCNESDSGGPVWPADKAPPTDAKSLRILVRTIGSRSGLGSAIRPRRLRMALEWVCTQAPNGVNISVGWLVRDCLLRVDTAIRRWAVYALSSDIVRRRAAVEAGPAALIRAIEVTQMVFARLARRGVSGARDALTVARASVSAICREFPAAKATPPPTPRPTRWVSWWNTLWQDIKQPKCVIFSATAEISRAAGTTAMLIDPKSAYGRLKALFCMCVAGKSVAAYLDALPAGAPIALLHMLTEAVHARPVAALACVQATVAVAYGLLLWHTGHGGTRDGASAWLAWSDALRPVDSTPNSAKVASALLRIATDKKVISWLESDIEVADAVACGAAAAAAHWVHVSGAEAASALTAARSAASRALAARSTAIGAKSRPKN